MNTEIEYNKMAVNCFKEMAIEEFINHYDPEHDGPLYTSTVAEICDLVYVRGVNNEETVLGPRMRALVPKALRYQGKGILKAHVAMGVLFALMDWKMEGDDLDFLEDGEDGAGERIEQWVGEVV